MTKIDKDRAKFAVVTSLIDFAKTLDTQNNTPEMNTEIMNVILMAVKRIGVFKEPKDQNDEFENLSNDLMDSVSTDNVVQVNS